MDSSDSPDVRIIGLDISNRVAMRVWRCGKDRIGRLLGNAPPKTRTTRRVAHESTCRLPYEVVEMIIANPACDLTALKACSLTCRSWYTIAFPHIHHTLLLNDKPFDTFRCKLKPLSGLHELGLIPLVKEIVVDQLGGPGGWFGPEAFGPNDLDYFSSFANVRTLRIQGLDIDRFMGGVERYFGQFSPTLRSISLSYPTCSTPRQLSHFLSLFPNLDDVDIRQFLASNKAIPDMELLPFSAPKLRGQLTLHDFRSTETWMLLIAVCGGLQFRQMVLRNVGGCTPILLKACAKTLETLRFYAADDPGG